MPSAPLAAVVIRAREPARLAEFYRQALQLAEPKAYSATHLGMKLPNGYLGIEALEDGADLAPAGGRVTLWFGVPDADAEYRRWLALGAREKSPPAREESAGEIVATVYDPEDNVIGLVCPARAEAPTAIEEKK